MLVVIPDILKPDEIGLLRDRIGPEHFLDGKATAGPAVRAVKNNLQTDGKSAAMGEFQSLILAALNRSATFRAVAMPKKIIPPRFNLYREGMRYGEHVDNAIMGDADDSVRVDCSLTIFINEPEDYDGGELVINTGYGTSTFKLPANHLVTYPSYFFHEVTPVTRGERLVCVTWLQSMVRNPFRRETLVDLAMVSSLIDSGDPQQIREASSSLQKARKNLLRMWVDD